MLLGCEEEMARWRVAGVEVLEHGLSEAAHECGAAPPPLSPVLPVRAVLHRDSEVDCVLVFHLVDVDRAVGPFARVGGHIGLNFEA